MHFEEDWRASNIDVIMLNWVIGIIFKNKWKRDGLAGWKFLWRPKRVMISMRDLCCVSTSSPCNYSNMKKKLVGMFELPFDLVILLCRKDFGAHSQYRWKNCQSSRPFQKLSHYGRCTWRVQLWRREAPLSLHYIRRPKNQFDYVTHFTSTLINCNLSKHWMILWCSTVLRLNW